MEKEERAGGRHKVLQKQKPLALTFTQTPPERERKELEVGHCVSGLQKKTKRKKTERALGRRSRESGGLRPAKNSLDPSARKADKEETC